MFIQGATDLPLCVRLSQKCHGRVLYGVMKDLHNVPVKLQLLTYAGKAVQKDIALISQGISNGTTIFFGIKGNGGGGNDGNEDLLGKLDYYRQLSLAIKIVHIDECVSCGEHALYYCKECEAVRCQICNEMWHKHKSRRNHSVEVIHYKVY